MKLGIWIVVLLLFVAVFGLTPFVSYVDVSDTIEAGYTDFETGTRRLPDGTYQVSALTRMPDVQAHMLQWWFAES